MVELQSKIDKKIVAELPKVSFPGRIFVIYTEAEARKAIDYLNTHVLVGVDTETRPHSESERHSGPLAGSLLTTPASCSA